MLKIFRVYFLPAILITVSIVSLYFLRSVPAVSLWKGYTVFYVSKESSQEEVATMLLEHGCKDFISLENQFVPLNVSVNSPEFALAFSGSRKSDYLERRNDYFFDKSKKYRIYYIPAEYVGNAKDACFELNQKKGIKAGMSFSASYPWVSVLVCMLFSVALVVFSEKRLLLSAILLLPVLMAFSLPVYSVTCAICLFNLGASLFVKYWKREGFFLFVQKNPVSIVFPFVSLLIMILSGFRSLFLFVIVNAGIYGILCIYSLLENLLDRRYFFTPKKILSSSMFRFYSKKAMLSILICIGSVFIICIYAAVSTKISQSSSGQNSIAVPCPSSSDKRLVNFNDYVDWKWNVITEPYISVNDSNKNVKSVRFSVYRSEDGKVIESERELNYDREFVKQSEAEVFRMNFPALEKLLAGENHSMKAGYAVPGYQKVGFLSIILLLVAIGTPCGVYIYFLKRK